jgi:Family of unknown function (DUF6084)
VANLEFLCLDARPDDCAATPTLLLRLRIEETTQVPVHALALRCQIRIQPHQRQYTDEEAEGVLDLFGARNRWGSTLKPLQLAFVTQLVRGFHGSIDVDLPLPCSYDFEVAANKYLYALDDGEVPLLLLFSGTVFTLGSASGWSTSGRLPGISVAPVPWSKEAAFRLPVAAWRTAMDQHFPGSAWLRIRQDTFAALHRYRARNGLPTWEDAIEGLLRGAEGSREAQGIEGIEEMEGMEGNGT